MDRIYVIFIRSFSRQALVPGGKDEKQLIEESDAWLRAPINYAYCYCRIVTQM